MAGDPLAFLLEIPNLTQRQATASRVTEVLHLDVTPSPATSCGCGDVLRGDFGISPAPSCPVIDDLTSRASR